MSFGENLQTIRKKNHLSQEGLAEIEDASPVSGDGKPSEKIRIVSPHEGVIVNASKVMRSQQFKGGKNSPKYALYASDGKELSFSQNTFLGWYRDFEDVTKELAAIQTALETGAASYTLQYSVKCKQNLMRTIEE